ncbi:AMIN-like domain-containing (lipo)protein [Paenarthrobacter sp. FR1]|uniref:AMIN-like domain-containing (lipo)protein n=1 Tax=Paenarthrobacter sp. FR1 TaxID=3439548 RepID=UPI003DA5C25F
MRKIGAGVAAVLTAAGLGLVVPGPASAASYCGIMWGSLAKADPDMSSANVTNVRTGQQPCYDRLVIDVTGKVAGYSVQYVPVVTQDATGFPIPVLGDADLQVVVTAPSYNQYSQPTYVPAAKAELSNVSGYQTFRQVVFAGSFEGTTSIGLGVRARLPFRVFTLDGPDGGSRLVVDVAHRW